MAQMAQKKRFVLCGCKRCKPVVCSDVRCCMCVLSRCDDIDRIDWNIGVGEKIEIMFICFIFSWFCGTCMEINSLSFSTVSLKLIWKKPVTIWSGRRSPRIRLNPYCTQFVRIEWADVPEFGVTTGGPRTYVLLHVINVWSRCFFSG